jgi:hypothetical protein
MRSGALVAVAHICLNIGIASSLDGYSLSTALALEAHVDADALFVLRCPRESTHTRDFVITNNMTRQRVTAPQGHDQV